MINGLLCEGPGSPSLPSLITVNNGLPMAILFETANTLGWRKFSDINFLERLSWSDYLPSSEEPGTPVPRKRWSWSQILMVWVCPGWLPWARLDHGICSGLWQKMIFPVAHGQRLRGPFCIFYKLGSSLGILHLLFSTNVCYPIACFWTSQRWII